MRSRVRASSFPPFKRSHLVWLFYSRVVAIGLLLHATQSFISFCFCKTFIHFASRYFGVPFALLTSAYAKSDSSFPPFKRSHLVWLFYSRVVAIGLLLHATQSFISFCFCKTFIHFASRYFGVPFALLTSAYAKSDSSFPPLKENLYGFFFNIFVI